MRVAILGNSHTAALKTGYDALGDAERTQLQPSFFSSPGNTLWAFEVREGRLVPVNDRVAQNIGHSSLGAQQVDPANFDLILLHGLGLGVSYELLTTQHYSADFCEAHTVACWFASVTARLLKQLRHVTDKPIVVSPQPNLSEEAEKRVAAVRDCKRELPDRARVFERFTAKLGVQAQFLPQPEETLVMGAFTANHYCTGSRRMELPDRPNPELHADRDVRHMNADYGALVWRKLLALHAA